MDNSFYKDLLNNNEKWVKEKVSEKPDFFTELAKGQNPQLLWIGCADSRVPANQIVGTEPGEIFVHRNIANLVVHSDLNMLSVVEYAVNVLKVKHIIVCGHYGCGGVQAAMGDNSYGIIDNWLINIKDVYHNHESDLNKLEKEEERFDRLVDLNVYEQVQNLAKTTIVQNAWKNNQNLKIHGWVYELKTGKIKDLNIEMKNSSDLNKIYKFDL
ncbi:MAG: carbonate dehydratase [Bacteroidota bacterium]